MSVQLRDGRECELLHVFPPRVVDADGADISHNAGVLREEHSETCFFAFP